ncbi:Transposable element Tc1 transposase [Labeo rohita]|uniref:Transposable element Tc1 transposase n=1 Tax=Labeo rohita TaxID=84645 RepID=A0ABQ8N146_LABRO|nr:Transposable element Tc1 transposase [Labeo rohita]
MVSQFGSLGYTIIGKTLSSEPNSNPKPQAFIAKEAGCSQSAASKHPLLNHRQRQRRLTWAKEKKKWTVAQWSKVLFSHESKFCISFGNQGPRVWRKGGEAHSQSPV